jgi:hypothetical protein
MRMLLSAVALAAGLTMAGGAISQAPAQAPAGSTGLCKDGSYYAGESKKGACAKHGGVKEWYGAAAAKAAAAPAAAVTTTPTKAAATSTKAAAAAPMAAPAAGGGPGQVWVNASSKVYHCEGTKWYGKTKKGEYMTEAAAKAAGNHADHGKSCS